MKRLSPTRLAEEQASRNKLIPDTAWTIVLNGKSGDYIASLDGLVKLAEMVNDQDNSDLFGNARDDTDIPINYNELARQYRKLTRLLKEAFGSHR